jgi:hypothetical protein
MVGAFRADMEIFRKGEVVDDLPARRAFRPEPAGHLAGFPDAGAEDGFFEDGHVKSF